jgi:hypothetical protein
MAEQATTEASTLCGCGREVKLLNPASDTPKCVGCGYVPELCRCETPAD